VRLRQDDNDTVVVMIQPAAGVRFGSLNAVSSQLLALDMERSQATVTASAMSSISTNSTFQPQGSPANLSGFRIPNGRIVVVIDPGHGGADVGAVGVGDIHEADIVLPIAQQVGALLQQQGIQVVMTRNDDREIDLEPRVQMAERANATLFVSIHANSMGMDRPDVNGTETYYYSSGAGLAQVIQTSITSTVGTNDRGIKQARFYVLRRTTMPAVLVEIGYVTGNEDGPRLADSNFRSQLARAIAQGILQYTQSMASQ
jgi:N-acetylmuramoyl-L-alanine amidase